MVRPPLGRGEAGGQAVGEAGGVADRLETHPGVGVGHELAAPVAAEEPTELSTGGGGEEPELGGLAPFDRPGEEVDGGVGVAPDGGRPGADQASQGAAPGDVLAVEASGVMFRLAEQGAGIVGRRGRGQGASATMLEDVDADLLDPEE